MFLSCPAGSVLEGEVSETMCNPSLQWSPSPAGVYCDAGKVSFILSIKCHYCKALCLQQKHSYRVEYFKYTQKRMQKTSQPTLL